MLIYGGDLVQFYFWIQHYIISIRSLSFQYLLWYPWNFLGFPFLFNLEYGALNPIMLFAPIFGVANFINLDYLISLSIAFIGMFAFTSSSLSLGIIPGIISGLIYTFNGFTFPRIYAGHFNVLTTYCWLPISLYLLTNFVNKNKSKYLFLWLLSILFQLTSGFINIFIFSFFIELIWLTYLLIRKSDFKQYINFKNIVILLFFLFIFGFIYIKFSEVIQQSQRSLNSSFNFSSSYSLPIKNLITFLKPDIFGNPIYHESKLYDFDYQNEYNYWELSAFVGLGTIYLSILSLFTKNKKAIFFILLLILSILLSLGNNTIIYEKFFSIFKFYKYIRIPSQHLFITIFSFSVLGGLGSYFLTKTKSFFYLLIFIVLSFYSSSIFTAEILRDYLSNKTSTYYSDDFGDSDIRSFGKSIHDGKIGTTNIKNISVLSNPNWTIQNTTAYSSSQDTDDSLIFKIPTSNLKIIEIILNPINNQNMDFTYSKDQSKWINLIDINESKRKQYNLGYPNHFIIFQPLWKNVFFRINKKDNSKQIGIDRITIVSY